MSRPPPYYPVVPTHMVQQGYQQPVVAGQQTSRTPQATATSTIWEVRNHPNAPAFVSTDFGNKAKRELVANLKVSPILHSNVKADIAARAAILRQKYPILIRDIKKPTGWDDLYYLWDAADIQLETPEFLYYVLHRLGEENEELDRKFMEKQNTMIDEYVQGWVTKHRELVLNSVGGSMYGLFCADPSEAGQFSEESKEILEKALETHRLRLLQETSQNLVNAAVPNIPQCHSVPQMLHHQAANAPRSRAVSDKGDRLDQTGKRINRTAMPVTTGGQPIPTSASEGNPGMHGFGSAQVPSGSILSGGRNISMPLPKQGENMDLLSAVPHPAQKYDNFMEIRRNMPTGLSVSPPRTNIYCNDSGVRNKPRPRGNSIETPRNIRHQLTAPYGAHQNKFMHQPRQNKTGSTRGSPQAPQPEPVYVHNLQRTPGSSGGASTQLIENNGYLGSRMDLPNDARNLKTFQNTKINQSLDFGGMEGDPNFKKWDDSCTYQYNILPVQKLSHRRTLYLKGPDLNMFCTHQLKDLMSAVGNVVSIKFLIRPHNNGPVFVTFDSDVIAAAIKEFDGFKMPDGRKLAAGYPIDSGNRGRSGSNASYNSPHGDNHSRYMSSAGHDNQSYARRSSISQHRPSRSQSGQIPSQYPNGGHMTPHNVFDTFTNPSDSRPMRSYAPPFVPGPYQLPLGAALGSVISEVRQHESGIAHFQQQMPLLAMNNRPNNVASAFPLTYGGVEPNYHRTMFEPCSMMTNVPNIPDNRKENSPIKRRFTGDAQSTPPRKDSSKNPGSKHKKRSTSRQNTWVFLSKITTPIASPVKLISQAQLVLSKKFAITEKGLDQTPESASPHAFSSQLATSSTTGQLFTTKTATEPPEPMNLEITKQVQVSVPAPSGPVNQVLSNPLGETGAMKASEPVPQGKIKNSKKNKKQSKTASKVVIGKENKINCSTSALLTPTDSESPISSLISEDGLFSRHSTRKPSVSSIESKSNDDLKDAILQSQTGNDEPEKDKEGKSELNSTSNITLAPSLPNAPAVKFSHQRSKTGSSSNGSLSKSRSASSKDLKKESQRNNLDNHDSSTTASGPVDKAEPKTVKSQGKSSRDGTAKSPVQHEQPKMDSNKNGRGLPQTNQEKGKPSVSGITNNSSDWPALAPSKLAPASIVDGKPPQLLSLPVRNSRPTGVILPALPLKPRRSS
ncbi:hypothetical protein NHQ30_009946 [Ciborinia camelliae]|nr:hypothetical protein NHQ30_009946 [Ciborinia camelliae]